MRSQNWELNAESTLIFLFNLFLLTIAIRKLKCTRNTHKKKILFQYQNFKDNEVFSDQKQKDVECKRINQIMAAVSSKL